MATSIIQIDVKDEQLTALEERVKKLNESFTKLPISVKATGREAGNVSDSFKEISLALNQQVTLLQRLVDNTKVFSANSKEAAAHWRGIADSIRSSGGGSSGGGGGGGWIDTFKGLAVYDLAKYVSGKMADVVSAQFKFGLGLATGGMAGNLFGLDRLAAAGASGLRSSQGLGLGYGSLKAAQNVFGATFDPNNVMNVISTARGDISSEEYRSLAATGVGVQGDTADIMKRLRLAARQFALTTPEGLWGPMMRAYGLDKHFSIQDIRRFSRQTAGQFQEDSALADRQAQNAAVSDDNLRKWRQFNIALGGASNTIESGLIRGLSPLAPKLEELSKGLSETIASMLDSKGFKSIIELVAKGMESFGKYISSGELEKDLKELWDQIKGFAEWIKKTLAFFTGSNAAQAAATPTTDAQGRPIVYGRNSVTGRVWNSKGELIGYQKTEGGPITDENGNPIDVGSIEGGPGGGVGRRSGRRHRAYSDLASPYPYVGPAFAGVEPQDENFKKFLNNIAGIESGGQANPYAALGPVTAGGHQALGKYQVMDFNVGPWSKLALGRQIDPQEFLSNPQLQEQIAQHMLRLYVNKYGYEGAGQAWFGGEGSVGRRGRTDVLGTSVGDYGARAAAGLPIHAIQNVTIKVEPPVGSNVYMTTNNLRSAQ